MGPTFTVRQLSPDDWEEFARVRLECLQRAPEAFASRYESWVDAPQEQWRQRLQNVAGNWLALNGDIPVGLISCSLPGDGSAQLMSLYVSAAARGQGVGDILVQTVLDWSGSQPGVNRVELGVFEDNLSAQRLYLRHGFEFTAPATGQPRAERAMVLPL
ncbi:GNAT family N-acetyltransferase [Kineosporia babensis]|uniref:GNAT family N-acetyltransferase n=1 Tax=Kineosporia babensis TaxID=499548 RepID=A0A9X1NIT0_9ACTN|nr:GNAT family N-acetyltransferase [Kineosporia babensis]MCD5314359.1 GNAT family N-acetyltransferase [Kineosporia babensis]